MDYIVIDLYIINRYFDDGDFAGEDIHPFVEYFYHPLANSYGQAHVFFLSKNEV